MSYNIIATLGPASDQVKTWQAMRTAGATAFRLNTSHLSITQLEDWIERLEPFLLSFQPSLNLVLDLQGSKWRLGEFPPLDLVEGQLVDLRAGRSSESIGVLPVPHPDFFKAASLSNGEIVLNDAKSRLVIETIRDELIQARVVQGGRISPNKGITYTACQYRQESLSEKDQIIVAMARKLGWVRCAISYIHDSAEMARYRELIGSDMYLIAKLERGQAMKEARGIAQSCDELWVCRGDLGAEVGLAAMARAVAVFSEQVQTLPVPSIMAGQVLEHMTQSPTPTRSEVCYLWDMLQKGYHGFVLSDETAVGAYSVDSIRIAAMFAEKISQQQV